MVIEVQILKPASGFIKEIAAGGNTDEYDANPSRRSVNMRGDGGANMGALIWIVVPTSPAFIPFIQKIVQKLIFNPFVREKSTETFLQLYIISQLPSFVILHCNFYIFFRECCPTVIFCHLPMYILYFVENDGERYYSLLANSLQSRMAPDCYIGF